MIIREYNEQDLQDMIAVWNEVVEEGVAFPQEGYLDTVSGAAYPFMMNPALGSLCKYCTIQEFFRQFFHMLSDRAVL